MLDRDAAVERALTLSEVHTHLILNWATGVGKTRGAISIASLVKPANVLLIVAEVAHKDNWRDQFRKWDPKGQVESKVIIECYASLKNYKDSEWDLIILDEGHHAKSDLRMDILSTMKARRVLVLTATLSEEGQTLFSTIFRTPFYVYTITLKEAITEGILPAPKIYIIPLELDKISDKEAINEKWGLSNKREIVVTPFENRFLYLNKKKYSALNLTIRCTEFQKYNYLTEKVEYFKRQFLLKRQEFLKNKWLQYGITRKRMLAEAKTDILKQLLTVLRNKRFICFCGSIEQAEILGGGNAIHSGKKGALSTIQKFNDKKIDSLVAVNMLQEGQNLVDIEVGIIAQLDGQERAFIQKFGRTLRAEDPIQIILYFKDTRDQEYLEKALEGVDSSYVCRLENLYELPL